MGAPNASDLIAELGSVCVIIPSYNVGVWIEDCLESVRAQSIVTEILVIDDASTDETRARVADLAEKDARIRLLDNPGTGSARARNLGAELATTTYLAFVDGDDSVAPGAYETMARRLAVTGSDLAMSNYISFSPWRARQRQTTNPIYGEERLAIDLATEPALLRDRTCWNKLFRRDWWRRTGITFADSPQSNDIFAMTRALTMATVDLCPEVVYGYRRGAGGSSMTAARYDGSKTAAYLRQELACAELITTQCSDAVRTYYFGQIVEHDLWSQFSDLVRRQLRAPHDDLRRDPDFAESFELLNKMLDLATPSAFASIPPEKLNAYSLVLADRFDLLGTLPPLREVRPWPALPPTRHTLEQAREAVAILGNDSRRVGVHVLRDVYLAALSAMSPDDPAFDEIAELALECQRVMAPRVRLRPEEVAVIEAIGTGDPAAARAGLELMTRDDVLGAARPAAHGVRIAAARGDAWRVVGARAYNLATGVRADLLVRHGSIVIDTRRLPPGRWWICAAVEHEGVVSRMPARIGGSFRSAGLRVRPEGATHVATIERLTPLRRRALQRAASTVRTSPRALRVLRRTARVAPAPLRRRVRALVAEH